MTLLAPLALAALPLLPIAPSVRPPAQEASLLAAVPQSAYALVHTIDAAALRQRVEQNDWAQLLGSPDGEPVWHELQRGYESETGTDFDNLFDLAGELHGESLLFFTGEVAGFLTVPPADRVALVSAMNAWLGDEPEEITELAEFAGGRIKLASWRSLPGASSSPLDSRSLAFLDHPKVLGLYSGTDPEAIVAALTDSLEHLATDRRARAVERYLESGGGAPRGLSAFVDFTPFVEDAERALRSVVDGFLPDPTGLLGLEKGTWLRLDADAFPGKQIELNARLRIPEETLAARLADCFEPLPATLPDDVPDGAWALSAFDWNLSRFYATARQGLGGGVEEWQTVDAGLAAAEALSGVDPIEDIIAQLSGWFAWYMVLEENRLPEEVEEGFGFFVGLNDGERFLEALEDAMGAGGFGMDSVQLEGAEAFLPGETEFGSDGGWAILPTRGIVSPSRSTLVRGLRALNGEENASLPEQSELRAAFNEHLGGFSFSYAELSHLRRAVFDTAGGESQMENDPFESRLFATARRTVGGMEARLYTR